MNKSLPLAALLPLSSFLLASSPCRISAAPGIHVRPGAGLSHPAGPKVGGPLVPGGPTFGYGLAADLHTVEHGWRVAEGRPGRYVYVKVHNNSRHVWRNAAVVMGVYDAQGTFLRKETSSFPKPLLPGQTVDGTFGPVGPQDQAYTILGYTAHL